LRGEESVWCEERERGERRERREEIIREDRR
jgi:hypothetical protein